VDFGASYEFQLPHMDFQLGLGRTITFSQSHPPTPPHISLVAPFIGLAWQCKGGGDVII